MDNYGNAYQRRKKKNRHSKASFILALAPLIVLLVCFLFCLAFTIVVPEAGSVIWWLMIAIIPILTPVAIVTNTLSVIFGVIGLRREKTAFGWAGIVIVIIEVAAVLVFLVLTR